MPVLTTSGTRFTSPIGLRATPLPGPALPDTTRTRAAVLITGGSRLTVPIGLRTPTVPGLPLSGTSCPSTAGLAIPTGCRAALSGLARAVLPGPDVPGALCGTGRPCASGPTLRRSIGIRIGSSTFVAALIFGDRLGLRGIGRGG